MGLSTSNFGSNLRGREAVGDEERVFEDGSLLDLNYTIMGL